MSESILFRGNMRTVTRAVFALGLGLAVAGCSTLRPTQQAFAPDEYDRRHPIKLEDAVVHLDIFANGPMIDHRQKQDIADFARNHAKSGRSAITIAVPRGPAGAQVHAVRAALGAAGHGARITAYEADPRQGASPIRLSYMKLQANVDSKCGLWPTDLAGAKNLEHWHNRPYHNLGCSYQSMMAAQVADPLDFVRPRSEGQIDIGKRTADIEALRKGEDPSTKWSKDDAKVKEAQQ